jgi:hypothetical protein
MIIELFHICFLFLIDRLLAHHNTKAQARRCLSTDRVPDPCPCPCPLIGHRSAMAPGPSPSPSPRPRPSATCSHLAPRPSLSVIAVKLRPQLALQLTPASSDCPPAGGGGGGRARRRAACHRGRRCQLSRCDSPGLSRISLGSLSNLFRISFESREPSRLARDIPPRRPTRNHLCPQQQPAPPPRLSLVSTRRASAHGGRSILPPLPRCPLPIARPR